MQAWNQLVAGGDRTSSVSGVFWYAQIRLVRSNGKLNKVAAAVLDIHSCVHCYISPFDIKKICSLRGCDPQHGRRPAHGSRGSPLFVLHTL